MLKNYFMPFLSKLYLLIAVSAIAATLLVGCASGNRKLMEDLLNHSIGNSIVGTNFEIEGFADKIDQGDVIQYRRYNQLTGCEIATYVGKQSKRIVSWQYLSSPDKCWSGKGSY